jgi:hypothetical protein
MPDKQLVRLCIDQAGWLSRTVVMGFFANIIVTVEERTDVAAATTVVRTV